MHPKSGTAGKPAQLHLELNDAQRVTLRVGIHYCSGNQWIPAGGDNYRCRTPSLEQYRWGDRRAVAAYVSDGAPHAYNYRCEVREMCLYEHAYFRGWVYDMPESEIPRGFRRLPSSRRDDGSSWSNGTKWTVCAVDVRRLARDRNLFTIAGTSSTGGYDRDDPMGFPHRGWVDRSRDSFRGDPSANDRMDGIDDRRLGGRLCEIENRRFG